MTQYQPQVLSIPSVPVTPVTLILYDNTINRLHWLVVNYLTPNILIPIPYDPMNPPPGETHQYTLYILTQPSYLGYIHIPSRSNFDIRAFAQQYSLHPLTSISYYNAHTQ